VEQQAVATSEISRNVHRAAQGTTEISGHIVGITEASKMTGTASRNMAEAADDLLQQAKSLVIEVDQFLQQVRSA
jgi:methyl-accepting chemotaxis protein